MPTQQQIDAALAFGKAERENGTKLRVLLPCNNQILHRIRQNLPKGTLVRGAGTAMFDGTEWEVVEFYKPKQNI